MFVPSIGGDLKNASHGKIPPQAFTDEIFPKSPPSPTTTTIVRIFPKDGILKTQFVGKFVTDF